MEFVIGTIQNINVIGSMKITYVGAVVCMWERSNVWKASYKTRKEV